MQKIKEALDRLFERYRLIFWYDDNSSMRDIFENLDIEQKKIILDNNEFGVKYRVLKKEPEQKFLIYSPNKKPKDSLNLILDLILSNYEFEADNESLILTEIEADMLLKPIIQKHIKFFDSKKRLEKLKAFAPKTEKELLEAMISVILDTSNDIDQFMFVLLRDLANNSSEKLKELDKHKLDGYVFEMIHKKFGFSGCNFKEFVIELFQTHFYRRAHIAKENLLNNEAVLFVSRWMDSSRNQSSFRVLSRMVYDEINFKNEIEHIDIKGLIYADTFSDIDIYILNEIKQSLLNGKADFESIYSAIEERKKLFWYDSFKNSYEALLFAARFLEFLSFGGFDISNLEDGFKKYIKYWHKGDFYYRKFLLYYRQAEDINFLKPIKEMIEDRYLFFERKINDAWQGKINEINSFKIDGFIPQGEFFDKFVKKYIENRRVFVIISDALRYEIGVELCDRLNSQNRLKASLNSMYSSLPSYTQIGIASLFPHSSLSFGDNGIVRIDSENASGKENRDKILKKYGSRYTYISDNDLLSFKISEGREFVKKHQLIYIYHNDIDAMCDHSLSEENCIYAAEKAFDSLNRIIKQIFNLNGSLVIITADHGFLYQEKELDAGELCDVEKLGNIIKSNRRFIIGKNLYEDRCTKKFFAKDLGVDGEEEVLIAKSINRIRIQGGGNRFVHGGAALQEIAIPVVVCEKIRKDNVKSVDVGIIKNFTKITSNNIAISFLQNENVGDKVKPRKLRVAFYSKDNELLSNVEQILFDKKSDDARNLEQKVNFSFSDKVQKYQGQDIFLRMFEEIEGTNKERLYKEESFELFISFVNDFGDF